MLTDDAKRPEQARRGEVCIVVIERTTFPVAHVPKDCGFP